MIVKNMFFIIIIKKCFFVFTVLLLLDFLPGMAQNNNQNLQLMPVPEKVTLTAEKFRLDSTFTIAISGQADIKLYRYASKALRRLSARTGLFFLQDYITASDSVNSAKLLITSGSVTQSKLGINESYTLKINRKSISLVAASSIGAMRGLETFLQLLSVDDSGYYLPGILIEDKPRFQWRGLMIDASRHFMPVDVIKRNLDGMAAVKLNVFHWHLCDDQGFRVESKIYPDLHLKGSDGLYYTHNQIRDVIEYASNLGIRVVPEFDVPGHATSLVFAYPELGSGMIPAGIERKWGIFYPALNPASEFTYTFLDNLFGEMAALFPDKYFHIGGDELEHDDYHEAEHWNNNQEIQAFMKENNIEDNSALQAYFNSRLLTSLTNHGKILVGWDEVLHENMPTNIVIQSWRGRESMELAAKIGYQSILSNGYYIDLIYPARDHYLNDPIPEDIKLSSKEKQLILGGEATMWAEYISPETIDSRIWPRTAAIAERFWSPQNVNNVNDMYQRLETISFLLEEHGLMHIKNQDMLLRRLTRNLDTAPLKVLVDVIEPLKHYQRGSKRPYTSYSPLTRVVDVAVPDAPAALKFNILVDFYLNEKNPQMLADIKKLLLEWSINHDRLKPLIIKSPILKEIETLSGDLSDVAKIALKALDLIEKRKSASDEWLQKNLEIVKQAQRSRGQTELMIVPAIEKLIQSCIKK